MPAKVTIQSAPIRGGNPDNTVLEAALANPAAAAATIGQARAALASINGRQPARRAAFVTEVNLRMFKAGVSSALTAITLTSNAAAVNAAVDIDSAIAVSGLDPSCTALMATGGVEGMLSSIALRCGPFRDQVITDAIAAIKAAADAT